MGTEVFNLDAFKTARPSQAFQQLNTEQESLADGIGSSYGVIGYKGKVWTLRYRGEKHTFLRPDDGSPIGYIDVVILRSPPHKSKSYYAAYDPNSSDGARPICSSLDGVVPDQDVQQRQADACALCPRSVWKTDANGRKGRECTDYKRLAVLLMPNQTKPLLGSPLMEPVFLRVPPASLNDLANMGEIMEKQGWHYSSFITRISFDPNQPHPKMVFRPLQGLTDAEAPAVLPLRNDPTTLRIVGDDQNRTALAAPAQIPQGIAQRALQQIAPPPQQIIPPAPVQQAPAPAPRVIDADPSPTVLRLDTGLSGIGSAPAPAPALVQQAPVQQVVQAPVQQTAADVGVPEESDAALDDRIANLMKTM